MSDVLRDELDEFSREINLELAIGGLSSSTLPVVNDDGESPVVVALAEERLSVLLARVRNVGGYANVFVRLPGGHSRTAIIDVAGAIDPDAAEDFASAEGRPSAAANVGMFLDYLRTRPNGVRIPSRLNDDEVAIVGRPREMSLSGS
ncbi:hypothetical protein [Microbacterium sp.]|uniref:hypothetical protein n=1 Tax=Microbacterium sp. TaxID=51671 RepID=UPI0039E492CA